MVKPKTSSFRHKWGSEKIRKELSGYEISRKEIFMYNYTALFRNQVFDKMKYHNIINGKLVLNPEEIIENMWNDLTITINPAFLETLPSFIEKVNKQDIPSIIIMMWNDLEDEKEIFFKKEII